MFLVLAFNLFGKIKKIIIRKRFEKIYMGGEINYFIKLIYYLFIILIFVF